MRRTKKPLQELNLMDDFLVNAVTTNNEVAEPFCRRVLSVLLQRKIGKLHVVAQRIIPAPAPDKRGIRMDVEIEEFLPEEPLTPDVARPVYVYDLEPHQRDEIDLLHHNRFYQAKIDSRYLKSGEQNFSKMPELFVITITDYDPFGQDYMMYTVKNQCLEVPELVYNDGLQFLYFYTGGSKGGNAEMKAMLNYFKSSTLPNAVTKATREIHEYIRRVKISPEVEVAYMKYDDLRFRNNREGHREECQENILELLEELETIPESVRDTVMSQRDMSTLKLWLKLAAKATTIADWESKITTQSI